MIERNLMRENTFQSLEHFFFFNRVDILDKLFVKFFFLVHIF